MDYLYLANKKHGLQIHSFVLMPNHFHLLAMLYEYPTGIVFRELLTNVSKEINRITGRQDQNWGRRYYKCILDKSIHHMNTYKYIYQNPVRSRLCERVEDWPYSTLNGILGRSQLQIPVIDDYILFTPKFDESRLLWLNNPIENENLQNIKSALSKRVFELPKTSSKRLNLLEENLI